MSSERELRKTETCRNYSDKPSNSYKHDYGTNSVEGPVANDANKVCKATTRQILKKLKISKNKRKTSATCETSTTCEAAEEQSCDIAAEVSGYPLYIAKYEYQPRTKSDLGFGKKDLLYIINTGDEDWWLARAKDTEQEGFIPSSYVVNIEAEE